MCSFAFFFLLSWFALLNDVRPNGSAWNNELWAVQYENTHTSARICCGRNDGWLWKRQTGAIVWQTRTRRRWRTSEKNTTFTRPQHLCAIVDGRTNNTSNNITTTCSPCVCVCVRSVAVLHTTCDGVSAVLCAHNGLATTSPLCNSNSFKSGLFWHQTHIHTAQRATRPHNVSCVWAVGSGGEGTKEKRKIVAAVRLCECVVVCGVVEQIKYFVKQPENGLYV